MYLHLGQDMVVRKCDILGVFDLDNTSHSHITRQFLEKSEKSGKIRDISGELPRSFIVTADGESLVYLSQISTLTLLRRFEGRGVE